MGELERGFERLHALEDTLPLPDFGVIRRRHRRRVVRQRVVASTAALAVLGLGVATVTELRRPREASPVLNVADTVVPDTTGAFKSRDVSFLDARRGYALGARCNAQGQCDMGVSRTTDGGDSWSPPSVVGFRIQRDSLDTSTRVESGGARSIRFLDERHGFVFNPDLYATHDGGQTWDRLPQDGTVTQVSVEGGRVWLVASRCPETPGACDVRILQAPVGSDDFRPLPAQPALTGSTTQVRRVDERRAYVLSYARSTDRLVVTDDGGSTWSDLTAPCEEWDHQHLTVSGPEAVFVACTVETGSRDRTGRARESVKTVRASADGGRTWSTARLAGTVGVTNDLRAVSARTVYLTSSHGSLRRSTDGGRTWDVALRGEGYIGLELLDAETGWLFGPEGVIWRLRDGDWGRTASLPF